MYRKNVYVNFLDDCSTPSSSSLASGSDLFRCKHCPFESAQNILLNLHLEMHVNARRPFKCNMCSYNCFSAESLHAHLGLHAPPLSPNSANIMRKRTAAKRRNGYLLENDEIVPVNATNVLECNQCNYRTLLHDRFLQHRLEHVQVKQIFFN